MPTISLWVSKKKLRRFLKQKKHQISGVIDGLEVPQKNKKEIHHFDWRDFYMHDHRKNRIILKHRLKQN